MIAIAIVVNVADTIIHEALGHGLAALAFGGHVVHVSSVDLSYDETTLGPIPNRIVAAAGPLANIVTGLLVLAVATRWTPGSGATRYFLWLFGHVSLFVGGGYAMALSFVHGFGDMDAIARGLPAEVLWRGGLTVAGLLISLATLRHAIRTLVPFAGEGSDRIRRVVRLSIVPYLTMGVVAMTAAAFNPDSPLLIVISAGFATFGGNAFIAWLPVWMRRVHGAPGEVIGVPRSRGWIAAAVATLLFLYIALAPGLPR